jgi:hypothetical protein
MAIKKQTNLKTRKPQLRKPSTAPIDAVRNPNFDAAMADVNYRNALAQSLANYRAQNYPTGATKQLSDIEASTGAPIQTVGNQDFIDSRDPNKMYSMDMVDYIDPSTGEKVSRTRGVVPAPGSRFVPANQAGMYRDERGILNPIPIGGLGGMRADQAGITEDRRKILDDLMARQAQKPIPPGGGLGGQQSTNPMAGYMPVDPNTNMPSLMPIQTPQGQQGATASQYQTPQGAQAAMADYNKMLQQGMQRNQDMNQAAQNFAGMGGPQRSFSQVAGGIGRLNRSPKKPRPNSIAPSNQKLI